ncbi:MAG: hydrolase [Phycisphaerae bacterium]|nr:MAG: hydrolase [Planctomycetota bacterium]KAB2940579.1 MAG: hydrolase [Phycisphaerae bacterium]MBE7458514.1 hydrolase [Planctomycetia bacterium]MCK6465906.1 hydrolase [Phycisphaerae bacterium]MCL4719594.1 hydrolase [Phycisphaerae bacterium]
MFLRPDRLEPKRAMLAVIDVQEKLMPAIRDGARVLEGVRQLIRGARVFDLPILVTEQYPRGLGRTDASVLDALKDSGAQVIEKPSFSVCGTPQVRDALQESGRTQVLVAGVETHVCILQSALDLVCQDYDVFVCADAVGSRGAMSHETALHRMRQAGVRVTTVESVLFELCERCDAEQFKPMLELVKVIPPP